MKEKETPELFGPDLSKLTEASLFTTIDFPKMPENLTVEPWDGCHSITSIDFPQILIDDKEQLSILKYDIPEFIIFLDIDGVLNCSDYYQTKAYSDYREAKKQMRKDVKRGEIDRLDYYKGQICPDRMKLFNSLCKEINAVVVISSTWRKGKTITDLQTILNYCGAEFQIVGKTDNLGYQRGVEIHQWVKEFIPQCDGKFTRYAIIDDDSDMLLSQQEHFFQTGNSTGLTQEICNQIKRFAKGEPSLIPPPAEYTKIGYAILRNMRYKCNNFNYVDGLPVTQLEVKETGLKLDYRKKRLYDGMSGAIDARDQFKAYSPQDDFVIVPVYFENSDTALKKTMIVDADTLPVAASNVSNSDKK